METTSNEARLLELLDIRDKENTKLRKDLESMESQLRSGVDWMLHSWEAGVSDLPVPRLELALTEDTGWTQEYVLALVHGNLVGNPSRVPLNYLRSSGGSLNLDEFPTHGEMPPSQQWRLPSSFSELMFHQGALNLPAYVVLSPDHRYVVDGEAWRTRRQPAVLTCVPTLSAPEAA